MADPYIPPAGNQIPLEFGEAYSPPAGNQVPLEFYRGEVAPSETQYAFPSGWNAASLGAPSVRNQHEYVRPSGFATPDYGTPTIWKFNTPIMVGGFTAAGYGTASVILKDRPVYPGSINSFAAGTPTIINRNRWLYAAAIPAPAGQVPTTAWIYLRTRYVAPGGFNMARYGAASVTHGVRRLLLQSGIAPPGLGTAWVSRSPREVAPAGFSPLTFPLARVGGTRFLLPAGFDQLAFGTRIIPEVQTVGGPGNGFVATQWGAHAVRNRWAFLRPPSFGNGVPSQEQYRFGRAHAWNLRQYILAGSPDESGLAPPPWTGWTAIANRNRVVAAYGAVPGNAGTPLIFNNARLALPPGLAATGWGGHLVAHRVRPVLAPSIEAPLVSHWATVYNAAKPLAPSSIQSLNIGTAVVESNRRLLPPLVGFDSASFGAAYIDFALRTIVIEPRHSIEPPPIPLPGVKLHTRYLDAIGSDVSGFGLHFLQIHRNIVAPTWVYRGGFGEARIVNRNPEARTFGYDVSEFGAAEVYLFSRPVLAVGTSMQALGNPTIADTRRRITLSGVNYLAIGSGLKVTKTGAPPYTLQRVEVDGPASTGVQIGTPTLNQRAIWPTGFVSMVFGSVTTWSNGILAQPGISQSDYGRPRVELWRRTLDLDGQGMAYEPVVGTPRLSPHTIYAVKEAPAQAIANHPPRTLHYVGEVLGAGGYPPGERFGNHRVRGRVEWLRNAGIGSTSGFGTPRVALWRRYVQPKAILSFRMGVAKVGDGREFLNPFAPTDTMRLGVPVLTRPPYTGPQTVRPSAIAAPAIVATHWASHFHRELPLVGWDSRAMGSSRSDAPYQWQTLHVGPPMPTIPTGYDAARYGTSWVSLRVRGLEPQGFDPFRCEYDPDKFAQRMRVRNAFLPAPAAQILLPTGFDGSRAGFPNVRLGVHFIRPDGNAEQYRKGAF